METPSVAVFKTAEEQTVLTDAEARDSGANIQIPARLSTGATAADRSRHVTAQSIQNTGRALVPVATALPPALADCPDGFSRVHRNTATGEIHMIARIGSDLYAMQLERIV